MNDLALGLRRRIDLAAEPPFAIGRLQVAPALLQISGCGVVEQLEPKVMQVLVLLHRARGEAVSRAQLTEVCWGGVVVGDDSINRCISLARRALRADPSVVLQTIPRVGYRLYAQGEDEKSVQQPAQAPRRRRRWPLGLVAAAAVLGVAGALAYFVAQDRQSVVGQVRPLTREAGVEMFPAVSPDGARVAYAAGQGFGSPRNILVRDIEVGEGASVTVSATPADEYAPAWSPDGRRLAFVRRSDGDCSLIIKTFPDGPERVAGSCAAPDGLTWLGDDQLVVADRLTPGPRRLWAVALSDGAISPLTAPAANAQGDSAPSASADGRRILFRRTTALGSDDLYLLETAEKTERRLTHDGWKASGAAFSADGETVFFSSNREGDFGIWAVSSRGGEPRRASPGLAPIGRLSAPADGRFLVAETARLRSAIFAIGQSHPPEAAAKVAGADWDPSVAPDGALVFASDRSGANELWLKPAQGEPHRLTRLGASFVHSPRLSPDGAQVAFIAVAEGQSDVYLIGRDGGAPLRLTHDGLPKGRAVWSPAGGLLYTAKTQGGWRTASVDLSGHKGQDLPQAKDVVVIQRLGDRLLARKDDDPVIYDLDPATGRLTATKVAAPTLEGWAPAKEGVFALSPTADGRSLLSLRPWSGGGARSVASLDPSSRMTLAVDERGVVYAPQQVEEDLDLAILQLKRR